jgi:hypothetical protein
MNDPFFMRCFQCLANALANLQRILEGKRSTSDAIGEYLTLDQFHDESFE